jgi:F-type H+-transporting ATPase subunit delta
VIGTRVLALRYAKALFALGSETGQPGALLAGLESLLAAARTTPESERALFTPLYPRADRRALIAALAERLGLSRELRAFGMLLVDENRTVLLPAIATALRELVERAAGRVHARVRSAVPLSEAHRTRLERALGRRLGAQVQLETEVDPELLGGAIVRVGDLLIDGSLRTQLHALASSLRKGP